MMRRAISFLASFGVISFLALPLYAQEITAGNALFSGWNIYSNTSQTGLTSTTRFVAAFDTAAPTGNVSGICDLLTNKGRCTPPAGTYLVTCYLNMTSGGIVAAGSDAGLASLRLNGATFVHNYDVPVFAATAGSVPSFPGGVAVVLMNGTDYIECMGESDGAGNAVAIVAGATRTTFSGVRLN